MSVSKGPHPCWVDCAPTKMLLLLQVSAVKGAGKKKLAQSAQQGQGQVIWSNLADRTHALYVYMAAADAVFALDWLVPATCHTSAF